MMKKILCIICVVMILCCACGKGNSKALDESMLDSIKNLEQRSIIIDNQVITLDCDVSTFLTAIDETLDDEDNVVLESGGKKIYEIWKDKEKLKYRFGIYNFLENEQNAIDCKVFNVSQNTAMLKDGSKLITFPGGLQVGQEVSKDYIIELFGEPTSIEKISEKSEWLFYEKAENTISFNLWIEDGVIVDISFRAHQGAINDAELSEIDE